MISKQLINYYIKYAGVCDGCVYSKKAARRISSESDVVTLICILLDEEVHENGVCDLHKRKKKNEPNKETQRMACG